MEATAAVDGHQVFYRQEGQRGLLIVFLHGVPTSHHHTFANDARLLAALMEERGHEQMVVVGDDWGGSPLRGDAAYGTPKIEAIRALALRAASLDPRWMLDQPHSVADAILGFITEHCDLDALAQPYDGFPEVFGAQHVSEDFKGLWGST